MIIHPQLLPITFSNEEIQQVVSRVAAFIGVAEEVIQRGEHSMSGIRASIYHTICKLAEGSPDAPHNDAHFTAATMLLQNEWKNYGDYFRSVMIQEKDKGIAECLRKALNL